MDTVFIDDAGVHVLKLGSSLWLLMPIVLVVAGLIWRWFKLKERQLDATTHETAEKAAQYASKVERLEQRVAVLERILTDRGTDLADEIERLRDAPLN